MEVEGQARVYCRFLTEKESNDKEVAVTEWPGGLTARGAQEYTERELELPGSK